MSAAAIMMLMSNTERRRHNNELEEKNRELENRLDRIRRIAGGNEFSCYIPTPEDFKFCEYLNNTFTYEGSNYQSKFIPHPGGAKFILSAQFDKGKDYVQQFIITTREDVNEIRDRIDAVVFSALKEWEELDKYRI